MIQKPNPCKRCVRVLIVSKLIRTHLRNNHYRSCVIHYCLLKKYFKVRVSFCVTIYLAEKELRQNSLFRRCWLHKMVVCAVVLAFSEKKWSTNPRKCPCRVSESKYSCMSMTWQWQGTGNLRSLV